MTFCTAGQPSAHDLEHKGFVLVPGVLGADECRVLADALTGDSHGPGIAPSQRGGTVYALRNVLSLPTVQTVLNTARVRAPVESALGPGAFAVRGILFDKTPDANWNVPYHQDLAIPVRERRNAPGWRGWSVKAGIVHGQPPTSVLEHMVTTRLHLDPCPLENGPLRVLVGTHRLGRLTDAQTAELRQSYTEIVCVAGIGDILLMRPLLLHASSASQLPLRRRVLHIEWAAQALPDGLQWAENV